MKMANGTNSRKDPPFPGTRGKSAALVREQFVKAQEYRGKRSEPKIAADKRPARDLAMEGLVRGARGQARRAPPHAPPRRHRHRAAARRGVRLPRRAAPRQRGLEGRRRDRARQGPGLDHPDRQPGRQARGGGPRRSRPAPSWRRPASSSPSTPTIGSPTRGSSCARRRSPCAPACRAQTALAALTIAGARMLDLERAHRLARGRARTPTSSCSTATRSASTRKVLETWVEGEKVFDRSDPRDRLFAVGGYGAGHDSIANEELEMEGSR